MSFWQTVAGAALGAFLAKVISEFISFHLNQSSQIERDRDDDSAAIINEASKISEMAVEYWCQDENGAATSVLAQQISSRLFHVGQVVERLFVSDQALLAAVNLELNRFDDEITRGNFQVSDRLAEHDRVLSIESCANSLDNKVQSCRRKLNRSYFAVRRAPKG